MRIQIRLLKGEVESKRDDIRKRIQNLIYLYIFGAEYFDLLDSDKERYIEEKKSQLLGL